MKKLNKKFKEHSKKVEFFEVANTFQKHRHDNEFATNQIFWERGVTERVRLVSFFRNHLRFNSSTLSRTCSAPISLSIFKPILISVILILIILSLSINTEALGVRPAKTNLIFQPGETKYIELKIVNTDAKDFEVEISLEGELAKYVKLKKEKIKFKADEEIKHITKIIKMPSILPPGTITGDLLITELIKTGETPKVYFGDDEIITQTEETESTVIARVSIKHKIIVEVPRQEKYVEVTLDYREQNEDIDMITEVKNLGLQDVKTLKTELAVYEQDRRVAKFDSKPEELKSLDIKKFYSKLSKAKAYQGIYDLKSTINYDNKEIEITRQMILGTPNIKILHFDKFFKENTINNFNIDLENTWNQKIENIYADIELTQNGKHIIEPTRTTSIDISKRAKTSLKSFIDLTNINKGEYTSKVTVTYKNKTTEKTQQINILTEKEYNKQVRPISKIIIAILILLAVIAVLITILIIIVLYRVRRKT
jgi:hypothetical protein